MEVEFHRHTTTDRQQPTRIYAQHRRVSPTPANCPTSGISPTFVKPQDQNFARKNQPNANQGFYSQLFSLYKD
jgi:hypothetical protein